MPNGKVVSDKAWSAYWKDFDEGLRMVGGLLFFPLFVLVGLGYGLRAGILVALKKITEMMESWG